MLTAPNGLARLRILSARLYPEALVGGAQFSVWIQLGDAWRDEWADRSPRRYLRVHTRMRWTRGLD
jgi:hypothetical protein